MHWEDVARAAGGIGLFLLGMVVLTESLKALAGGALGRFLARFTKSPVSGALTGALLTIAVQSSSAITVAAVGFVGAGLLSFPQALGIVFGANAGTTVTGWLVALFGFQLDIDVLAMPLLLAGVLLRLFGRGRWALAGLALAGFALVFVGIGTLKLGMAGLAERITPDTFPGDSPGGRLALVGIGLGLTLVTHSSSAGVAAALAGLHAGTLHLPQALALVIGMDIGTTFAALLAAVGGTTQVRRTGAAHLVYNLFTGTAAFLLLDAYAALLATLGDFASRHPDLALVAFHSGFNALGVLVILPLTRPFARLIERLVPERGEALTRRLDATLLADPAVALAAVSATLAEIAPRLFARIARTLAGVAPAERVEDLGAAIESTRAYLSGVRTPAGDERLHARHEALVHLIDHLRRITKRRSRPRAQLEGSGTDARIDGAVRELRTLLEALSRGPLDIDEGHARDVTRALEQTEQAYRVETVDRASRAELDTSEAIARMDEMRRLCRIAHHAWRIVHHLRRAWPAGERPGAGLGSGNAPRR